MAPAQQSSLPRPARPGHHHRRETAGCLQHSRLDISRHKSQMSILNYNFRFLIPALRSLPHDHFPQTVARQKKLHGLELLKQLLQTPDVEQLLRGGALPPPAHLQRARILNAKAVTRHHLLPLGGTPCSAISGFQWSAAEGGVTRNPRIPTVTRFNATATASCMRAPSAGWRPRHRYSHPASAIISETV